MQAGSVNEFFLPWLPVAMNVATPSCRSIETAVSIGPPKQLSSLWRLMLTRSTSGWLAMMSSRAATQSEKKPKAPALRTL